MRVKPSKFDPSCAERSRTGNPPQQSDGTKEIQESGLRVDSRGIVEATA